MASASFCSKSSVAFLRSAKMATFSSFPPPRGSGSASGSASGSGAPPPPPQLPQGPQHPFEHWVTKTHVLRFNRLSDREPYINCTECLRNGIEVRIYLGRLPWQTRCSKCKLSFTAEQVNKYHTEVLSQVENLPWRHYLRHDFTVVPKMKSPWLNSELPEEAPEGYGKGSGKGFEEELEESSDEEVDLPEKAQNFLKNTEQDLKVALYKLRGRGFSEKILRDNIASVRHISDQAEHLKRDLKEAMADFEDALSKLEVYDSEGLLKECLVEAQSVEQRLEQQAQRSAQWLEKMNQDTETPPDLGAIGSQLSSDIDMLSPEAQEEVKALIAEKKRNKQPLLQRHQ